MSNDLTQSIGFGEFDASLQTVDVQSGSTMTFTLTFRLDKSTRINLALTNYWLNMVSHNSHSTLQHDLPKHLA